MADLRRAWQEGPFTLWLIPVFLLAFFVRAIGLHGSDLWLDEAISIFHARHGLMEIVAMSAARVWEHPPGYYLLLHFWVKWAGESEFALRYFSVAGGMLSVALLAIIGRRWFGRGVGWTAALFMAINPWAVQYSGDARMYAWLMTAALLSVYLLDRAFVIDRLRDWSLLALVLVLAAALHYFFGFVLVAYGLFLILRWRSLPASRVHLALVLGALLAAAAIALVGREGPRDSIRLLLEGRLREPTNFAGLDTLFVNWGTAFAEEAVPPLVLGLMTVTVFALMVFGIVAMPQPRQWSRRNLQWFMALLIFAPFLLVLPIFTYANGRHLSAMFGLTMLALVLAVGALYRWWKPLGILVFAVFLAVYGIQSFPLPVAEWRLFSPAVAYISQNARQSDMIVYTGFFDWPYDLYYNRRGLASMMIPNAEGPLSGADATRGAEEALAKSTAVWLNLYPGPAATEQVEHVFTRLAFPASKRWFDGGRGVVHYFAPLPLQEEPGGQSWDDGIRLTRWRHSDAVVQAGDALRLQFDWLKTRPQEQDRPLLVSLSLVGPDGQIWADRLGEPCNETCPVSGWGDVPISDRLAFYIPPDVPPGTYELRLGWVDEDGEALLGRTSEGTVAQVSVPLMMVTVQPAASQSPDIALTSSGQAGKPVAPGLTLLDSDSVSVTSRAGSSFALPLQFRVETAQGPLTFRLHLSPIGEKRTARNGREITQPAGPAWYPSDAWAPGTVVRSQPRFQVPGDTAPGEYALALEVARDGERVVGERVRVGTLTVEDRARIFELPDLGAPVDARWNEGIRLAQVALPSSTPQGRPADISLVWQASGPASRDWKVYIHLLDDEGNTRAQVDGYPAGGGAPTNSWNAGEVIVDTHTLSIPPDLGPGEYRLRLGLYDAATGERLPLTSGADGLELPTRLEVTGG